MGLVGSCLVGFVTFINQPNINTAPIDKFGLK
jgi:hypothetical protein